MFKALRSFLDKRHKKPRSPVQPRQDINQLSATFTSGQAYLRRWDDSLSRGRNLKALREFSTELFFFLTTVSGKWLSKSEFTQLSPSDQSDLNNMINDLREVVDEVSLTIAHLQVDLQRDVELERLAAPVLSSSPTSPDYSGWARSSMAHTPELLRVGQSLRLPAAERGTS